MILARAISTRHKADPERMATIAHRILERRDPVRANHLLFAIGQFLKTYADPRTKLSSSQPRREAYIPTLDRPRAELPPAFAPYFERPRADEVYYKPWTEEMRRRFWSDRRRRAGSVGAPAVRGAR